MRYFNISLTVGLCFTAVFGDFLVFRSNFTNSQVIRAVTDNLVHAIIGCLSAMIFFNHETNLTRQACHLNIAFCTMLSSFIDVDHFLVARSLHLKDLFGLKQRGILHCTTTWLIITAILYIYSYIYNKNNIHVATWMIFIAYTTHHLRDANRRGLWLYPFGHTVPVPTVMYIILTMFLPNLYPHIYFYMKPLLNKHIVIDYTLVV
ncbi:unnamed protein product [Diatraea saccharalis]|uniref:Transmembrane protein 267 n=1 Tax=Diatraea saccharalis TaxID=40085 RepID=A0A9N9R6Q2_9NEOP|nr:unnamed protein product [Diatraea saccharalis]